MVNQEESKNNIISCSKEISLAAKIRYSAILFAAMIPAYFLMLSLSPQRGFRTFLANPIFFLQKNRSAILIFLAILLFFMVKLIYFWLKGEKILRFPAILLQIIVVLLFLLQGAAPTPGQAAEFGRQLQCRDLANAIYKSCLLYAARNQGFFPENMNQLISTEYGEEIQRLQKLHAENTDKKINQFEYFGRGRKTGEPSFLLFEDKKENHYPQSDYALRLFSNGEVRIEYCSHSL